jgi:hydrogenase-4 transcriptional activator
MQEFLPTLLSVWREVGRHLELNESLRLVAPLLQGQLPADLVLIRLANLGRLFVETAAAASAQPGRLPAGTRTECGADQLQALLAWCRQGDVWRAGSADVRRRFPGLLPAEVKGAVLAGPLCAGDAAPAVLVFMSSRTRSFQAGHEKLAAALLEPFTAAVENDRRLHDLTTLRAAAEAENRSLLRRLGRDSIVDTVVGAEGGLRHVMNEIALLANSDAPVIVFGETGSGKEVVARTIHARSARAAGPFLRVNCGAIPAELVDSELFGHDKGSFTGAVSDRKGWFERADGGTLFLDEIGELPLAAQVRLLRILQDGTFERVGGERPLKVDVRVIAATHRDLSAMVAQAFFRQDLWYRISVFPMRLPPLRERCDDIPALAGHFALRACKKLGALPVAPSAEEIRLLAAYSWPGNVRELAAVIERALILGEGKRLEVAQALGSTGSVAAGPGRAVGPGQPARSEEAPMPSLAAAMAAHIRQALSRAQGQIEGPRGAAQLLGINPHTLRARMRKLGIDWKQFRPGEPTARADDHGPAGPDLVVTTTGS